MIKILNFLISGSLFLGATHLKAECPTLNCDEGRPFSENVAWVGKKDSNHSDDQEFSVKFGLINECGEKIIDFQFYDVSDFREGVASVAIWDTILKEYQYGVINRAGAWIIPPKFDEISSFHEGLACAKKDGNTGFLDISGNWEIPPEDVSAYDFSEGIASMMKKYSYEEYWINHCGKKVNLDIVMGFPIESLMKNKKIDFLKKNLSERSIWIFK